MALELLAGPFDARLPDATGVLLSRAIWLDGVGVVARGGYPVIASGMMVVELDGRVHQRNYSPSVIELGITDEAQTFYRQYNGALDMLDAFSFAGPQALASFNASPPFGPFAFARLPDRWLANIGTKVKSRALTGADTWVDEADLPVGFSTLMAGISRYAGLDRLAMTTKSGQIAIYNTLTKAFESPVRTIGITCEQLLYARSLGVWVAISGTVAPSSVRVFADTAKPTTLSNPVALSGPAKGRVSTIEVRLTGNDADGVPDELIDWSITAGSGTLLDTQSKTDASGYARARYLAPIATGSVTIQAQAKV